MCQIDRSEGAFDAVVFRGDQFGRPHIAVIDAVRPILGDPVALRQKPNQFVAFPAPAEPKGRGYMPVLAGLAVLKVRPI